MNWFRRLTGKEESANKLSRSSASSSGAPAGPRSGDAASPRMAPAMKYFDGSWPDEIDRKKDLIGDIMVILFRANPVVPQTPVEDDEYEMEAENIAVSLPSLPDVSATEQLIYDTFVNIYDEPSAGPREQYAPIAEQVWDVWLRYPGRNRYMGTRQGTHLRFAI